MKSQNMQMCDVKYLAQIRGGTRTKGTLNASAYSNGLLLHGFLLLLLQTDIFLRNVNPLRFIQVEYFWRYRQRHRSVRVLFQLLLGHKLRRVQLVHCHISVDDSLLVKVAQTYVDFVSKLLEQALFAGLLLGEPGAHDLFKPAFKSTQVSILICCKFKLAWLRALPKLLH